MLKYVIQWPWLLVKAHIQFTIELHAIQIVVNVSDTKRLIAELAHRISELWNGTGSLMEFALYNVSLLQR